MSTMINTSKIDNGVQQILVRNMGLRNGEKLLIITDSPSSHDWRTLNIKSLDDMLKRNLLAKNIFHVLLFYYVFPNYIVGYCYVL